MKRAAQFCSCSFKDAPSERALANAIARLMPREARYPRGIRVVAPKDAAMLLVAVLAPLEVEEFHVLLLDARHTVKRHVLIARGSLSGVEVHPREVFVSAIRHRAAAIVCAHNHPSADPSPSAQDIALTERLAATGELVGIPILDHLVIAADGRYVAFSETGLLRAAKLP